MSAPGRPLLGRTVLVTRPGSEWTRLQQRLRELGAEAVFSAPIRQVEPRDPAAVEAALDRIGGYAWIAFTSPAGVAFFHRAARHRGLAPESLGASVAAVGEATAGALRSRGYEVALTAETRHGRGLGEALAGRAAPGSRVLWVRPERAAEGLAEATAGAGVEIDGVAFYATVASAEAAVLAVEIRDRRFDAVGWTSPSSLEGVLDAAGERRRAVLAVLLETPSIALGPTTAAALTRAGIVPAGIAQEPTEAELERLFLRVLAP